MNRSGIWPWLKPEKVVDSVGTVLDELITNKEELAAAKLEVEKEVNRHFEAVTGLELAREKEAYRDVAGARNREVSLRNTIGAWVQNIAAAVVIFSFVSLLFCVLYLEVPIENKDIVNVLLGSLGTIVVQIFQYWFGSSAGSASKQELIKKSALQRKEEV